MTSSFAEEFWHERDERKANGKHPVPPNGTPRVLADGSDGTPYGLAALADQCAEMAATPEGERNHFLNVSAVKLAGLVAAGELAEDVAREALSEAASDAGLGPIETDKTIESGFRYGLNRPRAVEHKETGPVWLGLGEASASSAGINGANGAATVTTTGIASDAGSPPPDPLAIEVAKTRLRREALRVVKAEEAAKDFREPLFVRTLTDELALPDEPVTWRVERLMPAGTNVLLTAEFKTGKTTLVNNLVRALADQEAFLDRFAVEPLDGGRVVIYNYEVERGQFRRWLREANIQNTDAVSVLNLRGYRLPVVAADIEDWIVRHLAELGARVWIVDPYARAAVGSVTNENDSSEAGVFLDTLDVIKERAGVGELVLPTHTGRERFEIGQERARGATRIDDWADIRWMLTRDDEGVRYFSASGRDVAVDEETLNYDESRRAYKLGGWDRRTAKKQRVEEGIVKFLSTHPGANSRALRDGVKGTGSEVDAKRDNLVERGQVVAVPGKGREVCYYLKGSEPHVSESVSESVSA